MNKEMATKEYELAFLAAKPETAAVEGLLRQYGAEISYHSNLSEVRLAYPIKKNRQAYFGFFQFKASPDTLDKIAQSLKVMPLVLRTLLIASPIKKMEKPRQPSESKFSYNKLESDLVEGVARSPAGTLSNKALEEKLEEILK